MRVELTAWLPDSTPGPVVCGLCDLCGPQDISKCGSFPFTAKGSAYIGPTDFSGVLLGSCHTMKKLDVFDSNP